MLIAAAVMTVSFKPYYKWITFNTYSLLLGVPVYCIFVLNLIINGLPSIHINKSIHKLLVIVLNLIINGLPSIRIETGVIAEACMVLNLIINGLPSIHVKYYINDTEAWEF